MYKVTLLLGILACAFVPIGCHNKPAVTTAETTCTDSLQAKIEAAPWGGTVIANDCIYRETVTVDKPLTLKASSGTEIRGSDVWKEWSKSGSYWTSQDTLPSFSASGQCVTGTSRCVWPEQVFFDGKPLTQVASEPESWQFAVDSSRNILLADDPSEHTVEVTTRTEWVEGGSSDVIIEGFTMKHAANDAQNGALYNNGYSNWTVQNNTLADAHALNVKLDYGTDLKFLGNDVSRAGQLGVGGYGGAKVELHNNYIHHNNTEDFEFGWEAGGVKLAGSQDLVADSNTVYENNGHGLWCDGGCKDATIINNRLHHNANSAIFYEISDNAEIYGNTLWENGWEARRGSWMASVRSVNSRNVEIHHNVVAWNYGNIAVVATDRGDSYYNDIHDNYVHDNTVLAEDFSSSEPLDSGHRSHALAWLGPLMDPAKKNSAANNRYWYSTPEDSIPRFYYDERGIIELTDFNATQGEEQGRYLTDAEKDKIVSSAKIPASPEER